MQAETLGTSEITKPRRDMNERIDSRRLRIYAVPHRLIRGARGAHRIIGVKLPADAVVIDSYEDFWTNSHALMIHSEDFSPVPDGNSICNFGLVRIEAIPGREDERFRIEV